MITAEEKKVAFKPLTKEEIERRAPAIFAEKPMEEKVSKKYSFLSTADLIDTVGEQGWQAVRVDQQTARDPKFADYKKHLIRFRNPKMLGDGDNIPELVLLNSHDGTTRFKFFLGIYRLVCSNGLVIAKAEFQRIMLRHVGFGKEEVTHVIGSVMKYAGKVFGQIEAMQKITLTESQRTVFASQVVKMKWRGEQRIEPADLLKPRRKEDEGHDLWTTYNVMQENIMKGGVAYNDEKGKTKTLREIKSVREDIRFNTKLWDMVEARMQKGAKK